MNIRDLGYAVALAELGHFGRAAAACHVSQPTLSGQIRKLEDELGVAMFERTKRAVRITPAGEDIVAHARALLRIADLIRDTARARANPLGGPLRLGMIPTVGPYLAPRLLPSIAHRLPDMTPQLSEEMTEALEAALLEGRIDAAVVATPAEDPRLAEIPLYDEPFWIALPRRHRLAAAEGDVDLGDIGLEEFLLLAEGHCLRDQVLSVCADVLGREPSVSTQHTSLATLLALVGVGAGVTLVPAMSLGDGGATDSGLTIRREASGAAARRVRLVFRNSFPRRRLLETLASIVCAVLPDTVFPQRR